MYVVRLGVTKKLSTTWDGNDSLQHDDLIVHEFINSLALK